MSEERCGGTGLIYYWDGGAYAGEFCPGCLDCEPPEESEAVDAVDPIASDPGKLTTREKENQRG